MLLSQKRALNIAADTRAVSSVTISRTSSLRDQCRDPMPEDPVSEENGTLDLNKRSLSHDKMSSDSMIPIFVPQRGNSLRQNGKSTFLMSSPNSSKRHPFEIIKQIDTSPRQSESSIDPETLSSVKVSQRLKFKHRPQNVSQAGPLIPDHSLMKDSPREAVHFTPRPPLVKKFSSDQDEPNSDIENATQAGKNSRYYSIGLATVAPRPPISPTRGIVQAIRSASNPATSIIEKDNKQLDNSEEDTSELEDNRNSDCEHSPLSQCPAEPKGNTQHRSSLRKNSDSPIQSDGQGRGSPSPTKSVKWNMNTEVKKIPRSRSLNGMFKSSKSRSHRPSNYKTNRLLHCDQKLMECHESYISQCTSLIRHQMSLLENLRNNKISVPHYRKDLADFLESQKKLVTNLQNVLANAVADQETSHPD